MIKYIGSKRKLIPDILYTIKPYMGDIKTVCDLFAGTTRVGQAFKKEGKYVISNDLADYSYAFSRTYIQTNKDESNIHFLESTIQYLNSLPTEDGYFTETFCRQSKFFQTFNGMKIDAIRNKIEFLKNRDFINEDEYYILLTSLIEAADKIDNTTAIQMSYLKDWCKRSYNFIELKLPELISGDGLASQGDANSNAMGLEVDLVYIDPPYNQHKYAGNYHIWDTLVKNDKPSYYGVACKREDVKDNKSSYNYKNEIAAAFEDLIKQLFLCKYLLISFSDEGYLLKRQIERMLSDWEVETIEIEYDRYVGAKIGIHNPEGKKVGKISHLKNKEYLFLARNKKC